MKSGLGTSKFWLLVIMLITAMVMSACAPAATTTPEAEDEATEEAEPTEAEEEAEPTEVEEEEEATEAAPEATEAAEESALPSVLTLPDEIAGGREVTITVVEKPTEAQPELLANWQAQVDRFTAKYPNVTVVGDEYEYAPDTFAALVAAGQVPTLFEAYMTDPGKMIEQGIAADVTPYLEEAGVLDVYNPRIMSLVSDDEGNVYGIPLFAYAMGLAYNIEMLEAAGYDAPPTTWDEALEMAAALTDRDNGVAGLSLITDGSGATGWHATTLGYSFGLEQGDIVAADGDGYVASFDNEAMLNTLNLIHDLRWSADVLPRENLAWNTNGEALATERAAMVVMAGNQLVWMRQTFADADMSKFGFAPLPAGPNGESASLIGGNVQMVSAAASEDEQEAAIYFALWRRLDSAEIQAGFDASTQDPAVVIGAPDLPLYVGEFQDALTALEMTYANLPIENYQLFKDAVAAGEIAIIPEPPVAGQEYYGIMGALVSQIVADEAVDIEAALTEALNTYQTNVLDLLAQ